MSTNPSKRRKKQPTADQFRARIESQRQTIEELGAYIRIQRASIDKLRRPWWRKVAGYFRGLRYTKKPTGEPTP